MPSAYLQFREAFEQQAKGRAVTSAAPSARTLEEQKARGRTIAVEAGSGAQGAIDALRSQCTYAPGTYQPFTSAKPAVFLLDVPCEQAALNCHVFKYFEHEAAKLELKRLVRELNDLRGRAPAPGAERAYWQARADLTYFIAKDVARMADASNVNPVFRAAVGEWTPPLLYAYTPPGNPGFNYLSDMVYKAPARWSRVGNAWRETTPGYVDPKYQAAVSFAPDIGPNKAYLRTYRDNPAMLRDIARRVEAGGFGVFNVRSGITSAIRNGFRVDTLNYTDAYREGSDATGPTKRFEPVFTPKHRVEKDPARAMRAFWDEHRNADLVSSGALGPRRMEAFILNQAQDMLDVSFDDLVVAGVQNFVIYVEYFAQYYPELADASLSLRDIQTQIRDAARLQTTASISSLGAVAGIINAYAGLIMAVVAAIVEIVLRLVSGKRLAYGGVARGIPQVFARVANDSASECALGAENVDRETYLRIRNEMLPKIADETGIPLRVFEIRPAEFYPLDSGQPPLIPPPKFPWVPALMGVAGVGLVGYALTRK